VLAQFLAWEFAVLEEDVTILRGDEMLVAVILFCLWYVPAIKPS